MNTHAWIYLKIVFIGKSDMVFFEYDSVMRTTVVWEN